MRVRVDARMTRPAVGDRLPVPLDDVLVTEAGSAEVDAAGVDVEEVVEVRREHESRMDFDRQRLHAVIAERLVAAAKSCEVGHACNLEPHEVLRVVHDPLRVRFREPHANPGVEVEAVDGERL